MLPLLYKQPKFLAIQRRKFRLKPLLIWIEKIFLTLWILHLISRLEIWKFQSKNPRLLAYYGAIREASRTFDFMNDYRLGRNQDPDRFSDDHRMAAVIEKWCFSTPNKPLQHTLHNVHWQQLNAAGADYQLYLYRAYADDRRLSRYPEQYAGVVQILAMIDQVAVSPAVSIQLFCILWLQSANSLAASKAVTVMAEIREIWIRNWDPRNPFLIPILISCPVPKNSGQLNAIDSVSVAAEPCAGYLDNLLKVNGAPAQPSATKAHTVVCVKGMDFLDDISGRLVEWFEANLMLGVDKVVMYTYSVHANISTVLRHYQAAGRLTTVPLTLPGNQPNIPHFRSEYIHRNRQQKRRNELLPYNDCVYRHLHTHQFALIIDIDEVIVPLTGGDYQSITDAVIKTTKLEEWTAFSIRNAFYFDNLTRLSDVDDSIPPYAHMLRHPIRSQRLSASGDYGKSFVNIQNAVTVFNHFPLHKRWPGLRKTYFVNPGVALKNHYKASCPIESRDICPELYRDVTRDYTLEDYKDKLINRVDRTLKLLKLI